MDKKDLLNIWHWRKPYQIYLINYRFAKEKAIVVTATSSIYPKREIQDVITFEKQMRVKHITDESQELGVMKFGLKKDDIRGHHMGSMDRTLQN